MIQITQMIFKNFLSLLVLAAMASAAERRGAVFCEYDNDVQWAVGDVWPCFQVPDKWNGCTDCYDCEAFAFVSCDNDSGDCAGFGDGDSATAFTDFKYVNTYRKSDNRVRSAEHHCHG